MAEIDAVPYDKADLTFGENPIEHLSSLAGFAEEQTTPELTETPALETPALEASDAELDAEAVEDTELTDADEPDGDAEPETPTTASAEAVASTPAASESPSLDALLKAGKPLTYTVDGLTKETADIVEIPGKGAVIPPDAINRIRDRLQQSDRLGEQNKKLFAEVQGRDDTVAEMERKIAALDAAGSLFLDLMENPQALAAMLRTDANGQVHLDPTQREFLVRQMKVAAKEAEFRAREAAEQKRSQAQGAEREAETRRSVMDAQLTQLTDGLPPEDVEAAKAFFGPMAHVLFRTATADDVQKYPGLFKVGDPIFDAPRIEQWVNDRKALRAQMQGQQKAKSDAEKHNAAVTKATTTAAAKPLPPRNKQNGQFRKEPPKPAQAKKPALTRYERLLNVQAGKSAFGDDE